jgi:integrase
MAVRWDAERKQYVSEFCQRGIRVFQRMPRGVTKAQADEWEVKKRRELFETGPLGNRPEITLAAAIGLWLQNNHRKNRRKAESEARQWEPWVEGKLLRDAPEVAQRAVTEWTAASSAAKTRTTSAPVFARHAPATINRRLCILKAAAKYAWKQGLIAENVSGRITMLKENNQRELYLTKAQVASLMKCAPSETARTAIGVAAWTGLRASELLALTRDCLRRDTIMVPTSKSGKPRIVPLSATARRLLASQQVPLPISYWTLRKEFLVARKAAGLPKQVTFHTLRHTCASWLINQGIDMYVVAKILGHSTASYTVQRYAHLADRTLKRAMARLK